MGMPEPAARLPRRQATARDAPERSDEDHISKELKKDDIGREPANACEFQKEDQKSPRETD
jgi:hypothetical protein